MMIRPSNQAGFTIIELIMVVCMIAIVMAFAGPSLDGYTQEMRTKAVAREIYTMLQQARLTAIKENTSITADFTPAGGNDSKGIYSERGKLEIPYPDGTYPHGKYPNGTAVLDLSSNSDFFGTKIMQNGSTIDMTFTNKGTANTQTVSVMHDDVSVKGYDIVTNDAGGIRIEKK